MKEIEKVQYQIKPLIGQSIKNIYHHDMTIEQGRFNDLPNNIQQTNWLGVLIETNLDQFFLIYILENVIDYNGLYEFIAMEHQLQLSYENEMKLQTNDFFWKQFIGKKITDYKIVESENKMGITDKKFMLPQGIEILFQNKQTLMLMALTIEDYDSKSDRLKFSIGGELLACQDIEDITNNSNLLEMSCFSSLQKS